MKPMTATVTGALRVVITDVSGDLQVVGWQRPEIIARADSDSLSLTLDGDQAVASSGSDLILYVPESIPIQIARVGGDADLRAIAGRLEILQVAGDLQMRNIGNVFVSALGGDLAARDCAGDFVAESVGGDVSFHRMRGAVRVSAGADLYLREVNGDVTANLGADAALYLHPQPGQSIKVQAGGDILLRVPPEVQADFTLQGGDSESIRVDLPGVEQTESRSVRQFRTGQGGANIHLLAEGEVIVTSREDDWQSVADFDPWGRDVAFGSESLYDISQKIQAQVSENLERHAVKASMRAQEYGQRVEQRVEAAIRRAEEKMRSAERRSAHMGVSMGGWSANWASPKPGRPPIPPSPPAEPVSDEERLMILKMLQEKKISLEEADRLLAALEGK
ncbi:MAG: hypothetical protein NZP74_01530 [Anaerolineales bacterium]|nr:hypothetical protein [Anaerolineales bacterium]MDW8276527.1 hypothetical protein [Anaerolineales bacterium]